MSELIHIGEYTISWEDERLWIFCDDGEGGSFDEDALAKVIETFYSENF